MQLTASVKSTAAPKRDPAAAVNTDARYAATIESVGRHRLGQFAGHSY